MAKVQSFADKAAKSAKKKEEMVTVKVIETYFDKDKKSFKFNNKRIKVKDVADLAKF